MFAARLGWQPGEALVAEAHELVAPVLIRLPGARAAVERATAAVAMPGAAFEARRARVPADLSALARQPEEPTVTRS